MPLLDKELGSWLKDILILFQTCKQEMPLLDVLEAVLTTEEVGQFQTCKQEMPLLDPQARRNTGWLRLSISNLQAGNAPFRQNDLDAYIVTR